MKLYVTSVIKMDKPELREYAARVADRAEGLDVDEFLDKIYKGERICIRYPDDTVTTYEQVKEN